MLRSLTLLVTLFVAVLSLPAQAQFDEEADLIPGLVATYSVGDRTIERIDVDLSHDWGTAAPDPRLPAGAFTGHWTSGLLVRAEGLYRFHAYLHGDVTVELDGQTVLEASQDEAGWVSSEPVGLDFGLLELEVTFKASGGRQSPDTSPDGAAATTRPPARMQLFWSSDQFPLEPIPPHLLFREEGRPDLALVETGRQLFAAHRCNRCHVREGDVPAPPAPGLFHVTSGLDRDWLTAKLLDRTPEAAHAKMPSFGFSEDEASAVAAWIEYFAQPANLVKAPTPQRGKEKNAPPVEKAAPMLLHSVGCLACHTVGNLGESGPFGGGDLSHIGAKRSADWINTWLAYPDRLNVQHRMPVFKLTANERALLATALAQLGREDDAFHEIEPSGKRETELVKRGRELAKAARCAACHKIPAMEADLSGVPSLASALPASGGRQSPDHPDSNTTRSSAKGVDGGSTHRRTDVPRSPGIDWDNSCLTAADRKTGRPVYSRINAEAVQAYVNSRPGTLSPPDPFAMGRHVLEERNCLGCHERDLTKGIVATAGAVAAQIEGLRGQSESLIPPALTAVGDKLLDEPLMIDVSGEQKTIRLPWLHVRMPKFAHEASDKQALVAYLIGHDRIPAGAPASGGRQSPDRSDASAARTTSKEVKSELTHRGTDVPRSPADVPRSPADVPRSPADVPRSPVSDAQMLVIGRSLAGSGGFNCVACHRFGDYEPRNVALGTKGSDLKQIDQHMRPEYFYRWTRDPLRVVPGMEMPSIKQPVAGVLDGDLNKQLAAVWAAINDPHFTAPPNPAQVEQHLVLQPGDPPLVLRDVFTVSDANGGGSVARSIAMGFDNGHSLLFDAEEFSVRGWSFGDFAQQRTEGKSWYWDLAGVSPVDGFDQQPDVTLLATRSEGDDPPAVIVPKAARLLEYQSDKTMVRIAQRLIFEIEGEDVEVVVVQSFRAWSDEQAQATGIARTFALGPLPDGYVGQISVDRLEGPTAQIIVGEAVGDDDTLPIRPGDPPWSHVVVYASRLAPLPLVPKPRPELPRNDAPVTTLPGFVGRRLKFPSSIMPTAMAFWANDVAASGGRGEASGGRGEASGGRGEASGGRQSPDAAVAGTKSNRTGKIKSDSNHRGTDVPRSPMLVFTSLKGDVFTATDADGDGIEDTLQTFEKGLAAPFGVLADGESLLVAHKPELLRLRDTDGDGRADDRTVVADGWGYTDNYHDWTTGPVRDRQGNLYLALGSDYQQAKRPAERSLWRGKVLKVDLSGRIEPIAHELRFPQGIAIDPQDRLFVTDQQGVENTFNEIDHIVAGRHYGVEAMQEEDRDVPETRAAVQVPHPWTRSVNGLVFLPSDLTGPLAPFAGHGLGCEYNSRFLIRISLQEVDGELQGATYYFTRPTWKDEAETFLGPMTVALGPSGDLYVGSIHDSGWLGGQNTGEIVRLSPNDDDVPNGIRELRATANGFEIEFLQPVDAAAAKNSENYSVSGYTRVWEGSYATPDSGRYSPTIESLALSDDGRTVTLTVDELRTSYVYELNCAKLDESLFPATGHYTMNRIPSE